MSRYLSLLTDAPAKKAKEARKAPPISHNSLLSQSRTLELIAGEAYLGLPITATRVLQTLTPEDLGELQTSPDPRPFLTSFATALCATTMRRQGIAPPSWDKPAHCERCGPVYLWAEINVAGCPWCWNRLRGLPIPRPTYSSI